MTQKLSRLTKIIYGSGDIGFSLTSTIVGVYFLIFLTDVVHLQPALAGIAILLGRTWDYINDPIIGHISDRTRTRWGRRRPFLLFGALPFALVFMLMWIRPPWQNPIALVAYYSLAYVIFDTGATFVYMPYFALTPELTEDYDERTSLTSFRMFYSILGSLIAFTVPLMIIGNFEPQNASRVFMMGLIFGLVSAIPLWLVFLFTREKQEFSRLSQPSLKDSLRASLKNKPFIFGAVIYLVTWVCFDILQANLLYFIKYVVQQQQSSDLIMGFIFIVAICTLPFWVWVSRKLNKRLAYAFGIAFWAIVQCIMISLNASSPLTLLLFLGGLAGIGIGAAHVLPWSIIPDAIEWDEYKTGERHEGMFYSLITLMQKVASSIAIPLTAVFLQVTHYVPNALQQPASALTGIRLLVGPIPATLLIIGIIFALRYPLSREEFNRVLHELEIRRAKGKA